MSGTGLYKTESYISHVHLTATFDDQANMKIWMHGCKTYLGIVPEPHWSRIAECHLKTVGYTQRPTLCFCNRKLPIYQKLVLTISPFGISYTKTLVTKIGPNNLPLNQLQVSEKNSLNMTTCNRKGNLNFAPLNQKITSEKHVWLKIQYVKIKLRMFTPPFLDR